LYGIFQYFIQQLFLKLLIVVMDCILISYNVRIALTKPEIVDKITKKLAKTGMGEGVV